MKNKDFLIILLGGGIMFSILTIIVHIMLNISKPGFYQRLIDLPINNAFGVTFLLFILILFGYVIKESM